MAVRIWHRSAWVFLTLVVATVGPASAAGADGRSSARQTIVFARLQETQPENYEIWTMDTLGGDQSRLTHNGVADHDPVWSPDGTKIAWVRFDTQFNVGASDVWIMNADGSNPHRLTNDHADIMRPTWSPDGTRIAFTRDYSIWVINADGTDEHRISADGAFDFDPSWSPDGSLIAFVHDFFPSGVDLATMRPDGSHLRRLVHTRVFDERPDWSPDGTRIAYQAFDPKSDWRVYLVDSNGIDAHPLLDRFAIYPTWFPDGSRIALHACARDCGLYQVRANGRGFRPLGRPRGQTDIQPDIRAA